MIFVHTRSGMILVAQPYTDTSVLLGLFNCCYVLGLFAVFLDLHFAVLTANPSYGLTIQGIRF
jgi:hypothetical protein